MTAFHPEVYPMDRAWLTGERSAEHLRHKRPSYYFELVLEQSSRAQAEHPSRTAGAPAEPEPTQSHAEEPPKPDPPTN